MHGVLRHYFSLSCRWKHGTVSASYAIGRDYRLTLSTLGHIIVSMTSIHEQTSMTTDSAHSQVRPGYWPLQDAKARFSELVRTAKNTGPQHVTVHGRDEVVVIAAEEFRRLIGEVTGMALVQVMQSSPHREIDIAPSRGPMPIRTITL